MSGLVCFACGKSLAGKRHFLVTAADEQNVYVGVDCFGHIVDGGKAGYQPPRGGPRLYTLENDPKKARS